MAEPSRRLGHVVWRELICPDVREARRFYSGLFDWQFSESTHRTKTVSGDDRSFSYTMAKKGGVFVAGMMTLPPPPDGPPPHWMIYVSVADVDAALATAVSYGGKHIHGPADIEGTGRFVIFADPTGAALTAFRANGGDGGVPEEPPAPGTFRLETLVTSDAKAARSFYETLFGWRKVAVAGGPESFVGVGGWPIASINEAKVPHSAWYSHVIVKSLEPVRDRIEPLGGKVLEPEIPVPGVGRVSFFLDPGGAQLMLFEPSAAR